MLLDKNTTIEDILNYKKTEIQLYLKGKNKKISGSKLELAKRAYETHHRNAVENEQFCDPVADSCSKLNCPDAKLIPVDSLKSGWTSDRNVFPKLSHNDVENYLLHSSHRTDDKQKMECYRQFIRGYNFFKEGFLHKVMINLVSDESKYCYIRSKCNPSMKQGTYNQWISVSKDSPCIITRGYCSCPAGLGEGCTHIAGLLFSIEAMHTVLSSNEEPCTSKPCEWSKPSNRKRKADTVKNIQFKRLRYGKENTEKARSDFPPPLPDDSFRSQLCCKLSNFNSNAVLQLIPPQENGDVCCDLNVASFEEVETSEFISYKSDRYIDIKNLISQCTCVDEAIKETSLVPAEIVDELEIRTRGQNQNELWRTARICRITSCNFHDVYVRKDSTFPEKLIDKFVGKFSDSLDTPALKWGKKYEPIARKRYVAHKKLFDKQKVVFICEQHVYLGSSPDGIVYNKNENSRTLLEIKCSYSAREKTIIEACKMSGFCCTYDEITNKISLKSTHRYYSQVQGQMGICKIDKCDFILYTKKDFKIVEVSFNPDYWDKLKIKLIEF